MHKFASATVIALLLTITTLGGTSAQCKSAKRGVAYDLPNAADLAAVSSQVSWWYNWGAAPNAGVPTNYTSAYKMIYYPMLWNGNFNKASVEAFLKAHPEVKYLLLLNEPNVAGQATCGGTSQYCSPAHAAALWPQYEAIARDTGVMLVGPQITWGTDPSFGDPVTWLDAFYSAYASANGGREPRIDYLGFHWYDYGIDSQLTRLAPFHKPFWVTEFANWHSQQDGAQIDTLAKQQAQMTNMVADLEGRGDVFRYAWFTGRVSPDPHFDSLLGAQGALSALGRTYLGLPVAATLKTVLVDVGSKSAQAGYGADAGFSGGTAVSATNVIALDSSIDTASQTIYQTNRYGDFSYKLGGFTAGTSHIVKLHFAETYWLQAGQRVFDVSINGSTVLTNYDIIYAAGGPNKARVETFSAVADASGNITLAFSTVKDNAQLNAIEVD